MRDRLGSIRVARALAERLFDGNYFVRESAERLLRALGRAGASRVGESRVVAARLSRNYPWFVSARALVLLPQMGNAGAVHAGAVAELLDEDDGYLWWLAVDALTEMGPQGARAAAARV